MVAFLPPSRSFGIFNSSVVRVEGISRKLSDPSLSRLQGLLSATSQNTLVAGHAREQVPVAPSQP